MASRNDITGDWIKSKPNSEQFEENFDRIFRQKTVDPLPKETPHKILRQSRIDTVGQNGNDGLHYEYELDKSTGNVIKKDNP
jgi:predicted small secreted protein